MSARISLMVGLMVAGLTALAAGQNQPAQNQPAQNQPAQNQPPQPNSPVESSIDSGVRTAPATALSSIAGLQSGVDSEDTSKSLPQIPALLGGSGISPEFLSELERSNYLRAGVNVGATYDDNPLLAPSGQQVSNTSESIFPNISIEQTSSRARWNLGYAGGLTVNQKITSLDEGSHNLNFNSQYRLSPHINLRVAENFSLTTGFFDAGTGAEATGVGAPNTSLMTPLATERSSLTTVETNYHFALNDLVGGSGSFYDLHFSNVPTAGSAGTLPLITDSESATGSAFWLHHIFRGDWAGASYRFDRLTFGSNGEETLVHSVFAINTLDLSHRFTLTGFVGPQYSENQGLPAVAQASTAASGWSVAGGAEGGWRNERTSVSAGFSRNISDGGGLLGPVRLQNVYGTFRREFIPRWTVALTANHGTNQSLILPSPTGESSIDLTSAGVSLERNAAKSVGFRMGYRRDFQQEYGLLAPSPSTVDAHRNLFFVTLSYQWAKPLGM
jgi:hypothetical protein